MVRGGAHVATDLDAAWGSLGPPAAAVGAKGEVRLDIGNWVHGWVKALVLALVHNRTLSYGKREELEGSSARALLHCLPGVGEPVVPREDPRMARAWRVATAGMRSGAELRGFQLDADPICCSSVGAVGAQERARPLVAAVVCSTFERCGVVV